MTWTLVFELGYLLGLGFVPRVLSKRKEPAATLAWLLAVMLLPYVGLAAYFAIGAPSFRRRARRKRAANDRLAPGLARIEDALQQDEACRFDPTVLDDRRREIMRLGAEVADMPVLGGNAVDIFEDGRAAFPALEAAIAAAHDHVHVEYYIFRPDATGRRLLALLADRARAGVEVRLLVDGLGSFALSDRELAALREAGGKASVFLPVSLVRRPLAFNFRNHRKIVVVDGRVAFTGGLNVGDEYSGRRRYAWRDTHMRIEGPAVASLGEVFAEDWFFATHEELTAARYFPPPRRTGDVVAQVIDSGPDQPQQSIHRILFSAITLAERRLWLTTPYFVPDPAILVALQCAALRGVDVRILLPSKGDLPLVQAAGRSFYDELLDAGCRIWEYQPVMLHAKTMTIDGCWGTVGSANMDIRSFRLNFEVNLIAYGRSFAQRLEQIFETDLARSTEVQKDERHVHGSTRLLQSAARVMAPVL